MRDMKVEAVHWLNVEEKEGFVDYRVSTQDVAEFQEHAAWSTTAAAVYLIRA
jgi:hypothetical protein